MRKIYLLLLFQFIITIGTAQIVAPDTVCVNTSVSMSTNDAGNVYSWSFDTVDVNSVATTTAAPKKVLHNSLTMKGGISPIVFDSSNKKYYAFWGNWNDPSTIYRMDFGANPLSTPTITTISTAGMGFVGADNGNMDVVWDADNSKWYLFWGGRRTVGGTNNQILRVDFGSSLANMPASGFTIDNSIIGYPFQITAKKINNEWVMFGASNYGNVWRMDYGASLTNTTPTITALVAITNVGYFSLYEQAGLWYMTLVTTSAQRSYRYEFGANIKNNTPTLVATTNTGGTTKGIILYPNQDCRNQLFGYGVDEGGRLIEFDFQGNVTTAPVVASLGTYSSGARPVTINSLVYNDTIWATITEFNGASLVAVPILPLPIGGVVKHYDRTLTHTFTTAGVYTITLMVDPGNPAGPKTYCKKIVVKSGVAPNVPDPFIDSSASVCVGQSGVRYSVPPVAGATGYTWTYTGTGATINGTGTSVTVDFSPTATGGMLRVSAISVGLCGSAPGLPREMRVAVNPLPAAVITPSGTATFCQGRNLKLKANGGTNFLNYQWKQGTTNVGTNDSDYYAMSSGSYTVVVTNTITRCANTSAATTLTTNPSPSASIIASGPLTFCQYDSVIFNAAPIASGNTYRWLHNNVPGAATDTIHAFAAGSYRVIVTNSFNCNDTSAPTSVTIRPVPAAVITPMGNTSICNGDRVLLQANTGTGLLYDWRRGNNSVGTGASYSADVAGNYKVIVTDANNCRDSSSVVAVSVYTVPTAHITPDDTAFCKGGHVTLQAVSPNTGLAYQWKRNGIPIQHATVSFYEAIVSGDYSVVVNVPNVNGCKDSTATVNVTVYDLPDPVVVWDGSVLRIDTPFASYQWYLDATIIVGATSDIYKPTLPGAYSAVVNSDKGCNNISNTYNLYRTPTGLSNIAPADNEVHVYPNPATSILYVDARQAVNISIYSMDGREVMRRGNVTEIDISSLAGGMYLVRIATIDGNVLIKTEKIIKATAW